MDIDKIINRIKSNGLVNRLEPLHLKHERDILNLEDFKSIFKVVFVQLFKCEFEFTSDSEDYFNALTNYFFRQNDFFEAACLIKTDNVPSFDKGLLIIGNSGVGKTSVLETFEFIFGDICYFNPQFTFKIISATEAVTQYESLGNPYEKSDFNFKMSNGFKCFDDVKSEREASNFGKVNVMKTILSQRCYNNKKTIITCNYDEEFPDDYKKGLDEFGVKYDSRIYDRIFQMFNIIEVKGGSFRK